MGHDDWWISAAAVERRAADPVLEWFGSASMQKQRRILRHKLVSLRDGVPWSKLKELGEKDGVWLSSVKKLLEDTDVLLEDWRWEALRHTDEIDDGGGDGKVRSFFYLAMVRREIKSRLKGVVRRMSKSVEEMPLVCPIPASNLDGVGNDLASLLEAPRPSHAWPGLGTKGIIGRGEESEAIVRRMIDYGGEEPQALSIVGVPGIGKTTLARLIYDDDRVQKHFPLRFWVTLSHGFSITPILQQMSGSEVEDKSVLLSRVQEVLHGKSYLLVLDGVRRSIDRREWNLLKELNLGGGGEGSSILATTHIENLGRFMMDGGQPFYLESLADDDLWSIVNQRASVAGVLKEDPHLVDIRKMIIKLCHGIPLYAAFLGGLIASLPLADAHKWLTSLGKTFFSGIFSQGSAPQYDTQLIFEHLPSYIMRCLACCTLFPQNLEIDKDILIQLWIANDLILISSAEVMEEKAAWIFDLLAMRGFFQDIRHVLLSQSIRTKCMMHRFVHAALSRTYTHYTYLEWDGVYPIPNDVLHLSIDGYTRKNSRHFPRIKLDVLSLHTLIRLEHQFPIFLWNVDFSKPSSLRVLDLHGFPCAKFPVNHRNMKHVRYLDLSKSQITSLPDDIVRLYNLQTLRLSECCYLLQLPKEMRKRRSLRHLYLDGCFRLENIPPNLGQLHDLHTLTTYIVGSDIGYGIEELKLLKLGGQLELYNLKNVKRPEDAEEIELHLKENLRHLTLCWGKFRYGDMMADNAEQVLEALRPPAGLLLLKICRYGGLALPKWMADCSSLQNLIKLFLIDCDQCQKLPPIWQLKALEVFCLDQMNSLEYICSSDSFGAEDGCRTQQAFPRLKIALLLNLQSLRGWQETATSEVLTLPELEEMRVIGCPKLTQIPSTPMLKHFIIEGENKQHLRSLVPPPSVNIEAPWFRLEAL